MQEAEKAPAAAPAPQSSVEVVPEGIGISLEQVRALVLGVHKVGLPENDAVLMEVTILNAWLGEIQKLHARHEKGLALLMAERTDAYISGVQASIDALSANLSSASVEGLRKVFDEQGAQLALFKNNLVWAASIVMLSALVNVAVFVLAGVR